VPSVGHEALLLAGLEKDVQDRPEHPDGGERREDPSRRLAPRVRPAQPERRRRDPASEGEYDREDDPVLHERGGRRRPLVKHVARRLAAREVGRVRQRGERTHENRPADEAGARDLRQATQYHSAHRTTPTARPAARTATVATWRRRSRPRTASATRHGNATSAN